MGKHRKRRGGLRVLPYAIEVNAGALANADVLASALGDVVIDRMWLMSLAGTMAARDFTAGEGPVIVGVAHSDYTAAEIEECLEAQGAWDQSDLVLREQARRKVRTIGTFANVVSGETLNDGKEMKVKLGWMAEVGMTLQFWVWNKSGGTLTTGGVFATQGRVYARKG